MSQGVVSYRRQIIQGIFGFLIGRVFMYSVNPFAVAYVAATCMERKGKIFVMAATLAGMATTESGTNLLKYIILFSVLLFLDFIRLKSGRKSPDTFIYALVAGGVDLLLSVSGSLLSYHTGEMLALAALECIVVIALVNVLQWGVRFLLYENMDKVLSNEELISLLVMVTLVLYGFPRYFDGLFSVGETVAYFIVLYVGYRYGASAGAIAGASGGILAALSGDGAVVIGLYCLLGIGVGLFRQGGKILSCIAFFVMGVILAFVFQEEIMGIVELRGIVSSIIVFLAIPKSALKVIHIDFEKEEGSPFAKEDLRTLANYRMEDFSSAFNRLSRSFKHYDEAEEGMSEEKLQSMFEELSKGICKECSNCNYCWNKNYEETYRSIHGILKVAGENGYITQEDAGEVFRQQCIRFSAYMEHINHWVEREKINTRYRNQIAESRRALGSQMKEVAEVLGDFSKELSHVKERSREEKRAIVLALRQAGLSARRLSVLEKKEGRIDIQFEGRARGRNCVTKRDVAQVLGKTLGIRIRGAEETKNVVGKEYETIHFTQDTNYKFLTGMARVAKSGQKISGDNFSFLELGTGELLMVLSDGMGSGAMACHDSETLVDVLEDLLEVGFQKESAIRMLNAFFVMSYEGRTFTTLDLTSINLYTGECEFLKNGAAATFIKHGDEVETVISSALPVGVDLQAETTAETARLEDGDLVIMVTDGILDAFPGEDKEFYVQNILQNIKSSNPSDIANRVLMQALERNANLATDDMSVLVVGIWAKG